MNTKSPNSFLTNHKKLRPHQLMRAQFFMPQSPQYFSSLNGSPLLAKGYMSFEMEDSM